MSSPIGRPLDSRSADYATAAAALERTAQARQHARGALTARERIAAFVDPDSFREYRRFAGGNAAVVTGIATVQGRPVAVYAQDFSIKGGTAGEAEASKICALMEDALRRRIPLVGIIDSGGARIQEGVAALAGYGRIFRLSMQARGVIPQISVVLGNCAGGAVYQPALTDVVIMTEQSHMFITGPQVVKTVTGENVTAAELGGGHLHASESGAAHYLAQDEEDALDFAATLLAYLPSHSGDGPPRFPAEPAVGPALSALVPTDPQQPYNMVDVIRALVDAGEFLELSALYARSVVTGFACIAGRVVGIVANQPEVAAGTLDGPSSEKAAGFVTLCDAFSVPVVTLVDTPGYLPGSHQEREGIIRRGAALIRAYAPARTPLITVVLRKAYGGAYIVMGSKSLGARAAFAWPDAQIAVMGAEGAVEIVHRRELADGADRATLITAYAAENLNPNRSVATGEIDAVIHPDDTRAAIAAELES